MRLIKQTGRLVVPQVSSAAPMPAVPLWALFAVVKGTALHVVTVVTEIHVARMDSTVASRGAVQRQENDITEGHITASILLRRIKGYEQWLVVLSIMPVQLILSL